jgi:hypothetical protein
MTNKTIVSVMQFLPLLLSLLLVSSQAFWPPATIQPRTTALSPLFSAADDDKFSFGQRIESAKTGIVGLLAGGIALAPVSLLHDGLLGGDAVQNGLAQWEFDTDMGSLECALFAIVYRYCIRQDLNPQLNQGVLGAFVLIRTLSKIQVPAYCTAAPLDCGSPLGYFDWSMLAQATLSAIESVVMFGAAAAAMNYCFEKGWITKFP